MPARGMPSLATDTPAAQRDLAERLPLLVVVEEIRRGVVGHEDVGPAVVVVVAEHDAEAVAAVAGDARARRLTSANVPLPWLR